MKVQNHQRGTGRGIAIIAFASIMVLMLCMPALAVDVSVVIQDRIEGNAVRETMRISLAQNNLTSLTMALPPGATDVLLDGKSIPDNETFTIPLSCVSCDVTVAFTLKDSIETKQARVYTRTLNLPGSPSSLVYEIYLPAGAFIKSASAGDPAVVPAASDIMTDGEHIIVRWTQRDPSLPEQFTVQYDTSEPIAPGALGLLSELTEWPVWVLMALMLIIGIAAGALGQRHLAEPLSHALPYVPSSLLSPDELSIIAILKEGVADQKEVGKRLGWSKSKVSAIMTGLERKGIVHREKLGRKYRARIVKEVAD